MNSDLMTVTLDPADIPGAELKEPFSDHTIAATYTLVVVMPKNQGSYFVGKVATDN